VDGALAVNDPTGMVSGPTKLWDGVDGALAVNEPTGIVSGPTKLWDGSWVVSGLTLIVPAGTSSGPVSRVDT